MIRPTLAFALALLPATALAQTLPGQPLTARWGAAVLLLASGLLIGIGAGLPGNRWTRGIGVALWMLLVTAGACLAIYAMPEAARGTWWQLPALVLGIFAFAGAGEWTLQQFRRA